jgi:hypothetical protein
MYACNSEFRKSGECYFHSMLCKEREAHSETREDLQHWKTEYEIVVARLRGEKHPRDNGIIAPDEIIPKLTCERDEARGEQCSIQCAFEESQDKIEELERERDEALKPNGVGVSIMTITGGMTLRDWFAGQALAGMLANSGGNRGWQEGQWAELAFAQADAMLVARKESEK